MNQNDFDEALSCIKEELERNIKICKLLLDKCLTKDTCKVADFIIEHDGAIKIESDSFNRYNKLLSIKTQDKIYKLYNMLSKKIKEKIISNLSIRTTCDGYNMVSEIGNYNNNANIEFLTQSINEFNEILNDWVNIKNIAYNRYLENIQPSEQEATVNISNNTGGISLIVGNSNKMDNNQQIYNNHEFSSEFLTNLNNLCIKYEINKQNQDNIIQDMKKILAYQDQKQKFPDILSCLGKIGGFAQNIHNIQQLINDWTPILLTVCGASS